MLIDWLHFTPWSALAGGLLIGLAASLFVLGNGRITGISGLLASLLQQGEGRNEKALFIVGLLVSPLIWGLFSAWPAMSFETSWPGLIVAGLLVGIGTRYGSGCTSGHGVCGIARLSPRSMVATVIFMLAGFSTVFILRHLSGN
ncbi:YeeE/YedE family protein [Pseudomonas capsici]|uniref:YeeE/YedE family protein n=1 Tax=Pseudomonas capsici TaxID=2810614 RepID=A0ABT3BWM7_9PSED|nr:MULTISPECIES: YeeE/YedE family protein [Pseudomonas]MBN6714772.1 YeeE/YedE family protein [Pseudomonas capsici]MBN6719843.1 YeeE/YedE family protein [Pseudomonas capsici]MBN6724293.1 YeeE/YedE family protein [Pseudomonas capsici]MBX8607799.1 YeeE/YedE family protein [Pseudomonas cichorii]MCV4261958.1 YeeE/YedE family protein [Pseudomonas capsici]